MNKEIVEGTSEQIRCGVCGEKTLTPLFWATDRNLGTTTKRFLVARCLACTVAQIVPPPPEAEMREYYPTIYYPDARLAELYYKRVVGRYQAERISRIRRYKARGTLLDIGCGIGYFVKAAVDQGFEAEGLELDEQTAASGREIWSVPIRAGTATTTHYTDSKFDIVTFWYSFEHLRKPVEAIRTVSRLLKRNGLLVIGVQNFASIQSQLFGARWYHLDVPRHYFQYSPRNLTALLEKSGFMVAEVCYHSSEHDWAGILGSVMRLSVPNEGIVHKVVRKAIGYPITCTLAAIEGFLRRGGTFQLYAIRK